MTLADYTVDNDMKDILTNLELHCTACATITVTITEVVNSYHSDSLSEERLCSIFGNDFMLTTCSKSFLLQASIRTIILYKFNPFRSRNWYQ